MEHLRRNTNNAKLIYTIEKIRTNNQQLLEKKADRLIDLVMSSFAGILSSVISACIVQIVIKNEDIVWKLVALKVVAFLGLWIILWIVCAKVLLPKTVELLKEKKVDVSSKTANEYVEIFNTDIMQKTAEINEIITVIKETSMEECKKMNFIIFLNKYKEIVDFFYEVFLTDKVSIRGNYENGPSGIMEYSFNVYSIKAVIDVLDKVTWEGADLLENDEAIIALNINCLIETDFKYVQDRLSDVIIFLKEKCVKSKKQKKSYCGD